MPQVPDSVSTSLASVLPSAAGALGVPGFVDTCGFAGASHVVVFLVDGLGFGAVSRREPAWLDQASLRSIDTVLPTTTPVALTTLGTGLMPGTHGMVGASFVLPETDEVLSPLQWGGDPVPEAVQVEPTVFDSMIRADVVCRSLGPAGYAHSGLTRAALRGPAYVGVSNAEEYASALSDAVACGDRTFTYVYWPELDRVGHGHGVGSRAWEAALGRVGNLVTALRSVLPVDGLLAVTADHGMVDCPPERRIHWDDLVDLHDDVRVVTGEPRNRMIYLRDGCDPEAVAARWRERLGEDFQVWDRAEFIASGLLGPTDAFVSERLGDVIVMATSDRMISCPAIDPRISNLPGQHGAWSEEERAVPLAVWREP